MLISIAGLVIDVKNKYEHFNDICRDYEVHDKEPDFCIEVTEEELKKAIENDPGFHDGYVEGLEIYRKICRKVLDYDAMLIHSAAVSVDNEAYLFTAVSGTGKTTHISLWKKKFGDRLHIVNGDKPIIRSIDGTFYACGTPYQGKESYGENMMVPIKAICILERGEKNEIVKIQPAEAISTMLVQTLRTNDMQEMEKMLTITDALLRKVPFYRLKCNMDMEAADVSYNGMKNE